MKKGLIGVLGVAVLGYAGTSFFFGNEAEEQLKKSVKSFDHVLQTQLLQIPSAPKMNLVVKNYSRGLMSSSAKLRVKLDLAGVPIPVPIGDKKMFYDLDIKVNHGPFILPLSKPGLAFVESNLTFPQNLSQQAKAQLTDDSTLPQLDLSLFINFDESIRIKSSVPSFTLKHKQFPGSFKWKGMSVVYDLSKDLDEMKTQGAINEVMLKSPFANASIAKIVMSSDMKAMDYGLWVGDGSFSIPSIKVSAQGQKMFDLSKFEMKSSATMTSGLINVGLSMSLAQASAMGMAYGPANMDFSLKNLDAKNFAEVQSITQQLKHAQDLPKEKVAQLTEALNKTIPKMVSRGAELSIKDFYFKMPEGQLSASLNVKVPNGIKADSMVALTEHVKASGELSLPMVLVDAELVKQASRKLRYQQRHNRQLALQSQMNASLANSGNESGITKANEPAVRMSRMELKALAEEKVKKQVKKLIDNQVLIQKGANYLLKFTFNKGHLFINGKPFTPDMLEQ